MYRMGQKKCPTHPNANWKTAQIKKPYHFTVRTCDEEFPVHPILIKNYRLKWLFSATAKKGNPRETVDATTATATLPTPIPTLPYIECTYSVWRNPTTDTETTTEKQPKPKKQPFPKRAVWCAILQLHTHTKNKTK